MKGRWGVHVCTCQGKLPVDSARLEALGGFVDVGQHPSTSAEALAQRAKGENLDGLLIACCLGTEPFRAACRTQQVALELRGVDLGVRSYRPTEAAAAANTKALRVLRGELRAAQRAEPPEEVPLRAGKRVVLVTDVPAGLSLAESLSESANLTVVVSPELQLPGDFPARRARRGTLAAVRGRLGAFSTAIRIGESVQDFAADQVVLALQDAPPVKSRTGLHVLVNPDAGALTALPGALAELTGDFMKPVAIRYNAAICAGGAAGNEACGRCIPACPYQAIGRDPANSLRIAVDALACEACGACTAACPTSALQFAEPSAGETLGRMAGLLGPAAGEAPAPLGIVFHCSQQGRRTLEAAADRPRPYSARLLPVEVPCLRHVSDALLLGALRMGAAGVALLGCETCPHGERALLQLNMDIAGRVAAGAGLGAGRLRLITAADGWAKPDSALEQLDEFAQNLRPNAVQFTADRMRPLGNRELVAEALQTFIGEFGAKPEPVKLPREAPYANAAVRADGCTLCRSCTNVCPTHAFRFDETEQTLSFKQIDCVACGLCELVCPENVISLRPELRLDADALDYQVLVRDETIRCAKCDKPYINKRALAAVEAKLLKVPKMAEVFGGSRSSLLRMCPDCRAVAAVLDVRDGWRP
jgi:ferredoxin